MFPVRVLYIKRVIEKDKKIFRPMVNLKFKNVQFDVPIDDQDFNFVTPPDVVPEDITRLFLDRMKKSADDAAAAAKPAADATPPAKK